MKVKADELDGVQARAAARGECGAGIGVAVARPAGSVDGSRDHRGRTGFAAILANHVLGLGDHGVLLTAAAAWAGPAIPLWWCGKSALQHLVMFGGLAALLCAGLYQLDPSLTAAGYGTAIWVLSALWGTTAAGPLWVVPETANRYRPGPVAAPLTVVALSCSRSRSAWAGPAGRPGDELPQVVP